MLPTLNKQKVREYILKKHLKTDGNLYLSDKLFIANAVLEWIFKNTKNEKVVEVFLKDIELYLEGKKELNWLETHVKWLEKQNNQKESRVNNDYKKPKE